RSAAEIDKGSSRCCAIGPLKLAGDVKRPANLVNNAGRGAGAASIQTSGRGESSIAHVESANRSRDSPNEVVLRHALGGSAGQNRRAGAGAKIECAGIDLEYPGDGHRR